MAKNVDKKSASAFDASYQNRKRNDSILFQVLSILRNRYFMLGAIFCLFGVIILVMTSTLQFSNYQKMISQSSKGVVRQYTVDAPRGSILDSNGLTLAYSEASNTVLLSNAYLEDNDLNAMCLELSYLFDEYNCVSVSGLDDYFSVNPFAFKVEDEEVRLWQTNTNLFGLTDDAQGVIVTYSDSYVKTDPQVFFLYLRQLFNVDTSYTEDEAYRIIRVRYQIFQDEWSFNTGTPVEIAIDVPDDLIMLLQEQNYHYMGVISTVTYRRAYTPLAQISCHVVGYVGSISQETLSDLAPYGYTSGDLVGQSGVESQMERYLHGTSGISTYSIWTAEGAEGTFFPSNYGTEPVSGATVNLTIDSNLQRVGIEALKQYIEDAEANEMIRHTGYDTADAGAFVVMNVNSGAVLAMGSYPNYDPNDFILSMYGDEQAEEQLQYYLGIEEYEQVTSEDMPLWNRAIMSQYAPGSTFKMCTALAGLESGAITPDANWIRCESPIDIGGWGFNCLEFPEGGHGPLNLNSAMATSCNIYFMLLGVETGIDNIDLMGERLGLGEYSGIDLPGEICGVRASRDTKRLLHESEYDRTWFPADTAQSAIGQFDNCFTILQLCRYTAAIATNSLVTPYVIDSVVGSDGAILYQGQTESIPLGIQEENINAVRNAMRCVVTGTSIWEGTAQENLASFPIPVCCKTGTAETGYEDIRLEYSNGLFVCYAPADNPEIAIALVIEKGEWGASTVVIAEKILAEYFGVIYDQASAVIDSFPITGDYLDSVTPEAMPN